MRVATINKGIIAAAVLLFAASATYAEDGYRLWLRYDQLPAPALDQYRKQISHIVVAGNSAITETIRGELANGLTGLLGKEPTSNATISENNSLLIGTPSSSP